MLGVFFMGINIPLTEIVYNKQNVDATEMFHKVSLKLKRKNVDSFQKR
jgi:hypothetical protein